MSTTTTSLSSDLTTGDQRSAFADLIERLEKATGPDRELDCDIAVAMNRRLRKHSAMGFECLFYYVAERGEGAPLPNYTGSIDAALTLMPEGYAAAMGNMAFSGNEGRSAKDKPWATYWTPFGEPHSFRGETPATALCIAALRARAATASARVTALSPATATELA